MSPCGPGGHTLTQHLWPSPRTVWVTCGGPGEQSRDTDPGAGEAEWPVRECDMNSGRRCPVSLSWGRQDFPRGAIRSQTCRAQGCSVVCAGRSRRDSRGPSEPGVQVALKRDGAACVRGRGRGSGGAKGGTRKMWNVWPRLTPPSLRPRANLPPWTPCGGSSRKKSGNSWKVSGWPLSQPGR